MRADLAAAALRALADAIEAPSDSAPTTPTRWYSRTCLPQGARSWRAARERAARLGLVTVRAGREILIDRDGWDASLRAAPRPQIADADGAALAQMGLRLVGGGRS